jgi:hypothetical protein
MDPSYIVNPLISDLRLDYLYSLKVDPQKTSSVVQNTCLLARYLAMDLHVTVVYLGTTVTCQNTLHNNINKKYILEMLVSKSENYSIYSL